MIRQIVEGMNEVINGGVYYKWAYEQPWPGV